MRGEGRDEYGDEIIGSCCGKQDFCALLSPDVIHLLDWNNRIPRQSFESLQDRDSEIPVKFSLFWDNHNNKCQS